MLYSLLYMKKGPILLLLILLFVSIFMLGTKYGQQLKITQLAQTVVSPTLSPTPQATKQESITFSEYTHKGCGISFLIPTQFKTTDSSLSALLKYNNQNISIECPKKPINELEKIDKTTATSSVLLHNKNLQGFKEGNNIRFIVTHTYRKTPVIFNVDNNMLPIIQSSLKFLP